MVFLSTFIILFGFWIFLSGLLDLFHLSLGVIACGLVSWVSRDLLFSQQRVTKKHFIQILRFVRYLFWLLFQILLSNFHMAYIVLHPKMYSLIDPHILRFRVRLKSELSLTTFANSITLTPGTITILIFRNDFYVHSISQKVSDELLTGEMEQRVAHIYEEE